MKFSFLQREKCVYYKKEQSARRDESYVLGLM